MKELDVDVVLAQLRAADCDHDQKYNSYYDGFEDGIATAIQIIETNRRTLIDTYTPAGTRRPINVGDTALAQLAPGKRWFPARILQIVAVAGIPVEVHIADLNRGGASRVLAPDQIKPQPKKRGAA